VKVGPNQRKGVDDMLQSLGWAAMGTGFTFCMTTLGAALVLFWREDLQLHLQKAVLGFAAGVMTAASVWSLLIPAIERTERLRTGLPGWLPAAVGMLGGVIFLAALESILPYLRKDSPAADQMWRNQALLTTAITLHNIPEGMAVGLAFALAASGESFAGATALALGIGIQNFPEGAAIALPLRSAGRARAFCRGMMSGIVEPVFGILVVLVAGWAEMLMPWLLSFAAGAMLYVVVEELVPQAHSRAGTCGFVLGFLVMMVLDVALG
jgi:ZIP family zinc transporter